MLFLDFDGSPTLPTTPSLSLATTISLHSACVPVFNFILIPSPLLLPVTTRKIRSLQAVKRKAAKKLLKRSQTT